LKNIKHEYENSRKLARNTKRRIVSEKKLHAFFMNMAAEKPGVLALTNSVACDSDRFMNHVQIRSKTHKNESFFIYLTFFY
jgi:hypothetical protein